MGELTFAFQPEIGIEWLPWGKSINHGYQRGVTIGWLYFRITFKICSVKLIPEGNNNG